MLLRILQAITDELVKALTKDNKASQHRQEPVIATDPFTVGNGDANQAVYDGAVSLFKRKFSAVNALSSENETWAPEYTPVNPFRKQRVNVDPTESAQQ